MLQWKHGRIEQIMKIERFFSNVILKSQIMCVSALHKLQYLNEANKKLLVSIASSFMIWLEALLF